MIVAVNTTLQLVLLRGLMTNTKVVGPTPLTAYIIPRNDPHNHEDICIPACAAASARLQYISGYSGSNGIAVVTLTEALLWTDGRYFISARSELDENWTLMKDGLRDTPTIEEYLGSKLDAGGNIGADPSLFNTALWSKLEENLKGSQLALLPVSTNLIDEVWKAVGKKVPCPKNHLLKINIKYTGKSTHDKLVDLRKIMTEKAAVGIILVQLDDISWLLNVRGFDIPSSGVFWSYVLIKQNDFELFVDKDKLGDEVRKSIVEDGGSIYNYEEINDRLSNLIAHTKGKIIVDSFSSYSLVNVVPANRRILQLSPITMMKAVKNPVEIEGYKAAHIRDAALLVRLYAWLENAILSGETVTEYNATEKIMGFRKEHELFITTSFPTIAGVDANAAMSHYFPTNETAKQITSTSMLVFDSGAIYQDGTTDLTRTFHFGVPTNHQRNCYTRVLKGQIAIANVIFPPYIIGNRLDSFARKALWEAGLDFGHGTGHGIGIDVHEGPTKLTYDYKFAPNDQGLRENMLTSNEPGYYEKGNFGIRLENVVRYVNSSVIGKDGQPFLTIEDLSFLPYSHKLIDKSLLTSEEIEYLNKYQEKCRNIVGKYIQENYPDDSAYEWLMKETPPF